MAVWAPHEILSDKSRQEARVQASEDRTFNWLVILISVAFVAILWPYNGAILWGTALAIVFAPLNRRFVRSMKGRRSLASLATLAIVILLVILPLAFVATMLVREASAVYAKVQSGEVNFGTYFRQLFDALPSWATSLLNRFGLADVAAIQERLSGGFAEGSQAIAGKALGWGENTLDFVVSLFVMLYLLFFLLRDGDALVRRIRAAIPLREEQQRELLEKFTVVTRATVKGNIVVAAIQGALGGLAFWALGIHAPALWGFLMAVLSLLPAIGAAIVWGPVALYLLATGSVWQGFALIAFGVLVIGLVDNLLRPILVGKDTRMPDYIVLISTLGGIAIFGINGFIIGPVIAALFMAAWDIFAAKRRRLEPPAER
jgi:predicted PurR-regulated permease PerM